MVITWGNSTLFILLGEKVSSKKTHYTPIQIETQTIICPHVKEVDRNQRYQAIKLKSDVDYAFPIEACFCALTHMTQYSCKSHDFLLFDFEFEFSFKLKFTKQVQ